MQDRACLANGHVGLDLSHLLQLLDPPQVLASCGSQMPGLCTVLLVVIIVTLRRNQVQNNTFFFNKPGKQTKP
jgi:hypothetical protein